jgi:uncharacterized membrane protein HdeD (DUF308 family)
MSAGNNQINPPSQAPRKELDLDLEVVVLIIFGVFMTLFAFLLLKIHTGELPYTPDSTYGLFLVLVSIQTITMGKTPFGDLRRSWVVIILGICTAVLGMAACFIPGTLTEVVRVLSGILLAVGGALLLMQLLVMKDRAKTWLKVPGVLRHLTLSAALVYVLSILAGLVTLLPGITTNPQTAVLLLAYGFCIFYLAICIQETRRKYPAGRAGLETSPGTGAGAAAGTPGFSLFGETSFPLSLAVIALLGVLLVLLGLLLFPVNQGLLPFSPDGQLGLLLVIMSLQMMALGSTPVGQFRRSRAMTLLGVVFAGLGVFSCVVPGVLTGSIQFLLGFLNIIGGVIPMVLRFLPAILDRSGAAAAPVLPIVRKLNITQTVLNIVGIAFGLSMFMPGVIPGNVIAAIVIVNGLLLFLLVAILNAIDRMNQAGGQPGGSPGAGAAGS